MGREVEKIGRRGHFSGGASARLRFTDILRFFHELKNELQKNHEEIMGKLGCLHKEIRELVEEIFPKNIQEGLKEQTTGLSDIKAKLQDQTQESLSIEKKQKENDFLNEKAEQRIETLETQSRLNNLRFQGIPENFDQQNLEKNFRELLQNYIKTQGDFPDIDQIYKFKICTKE